MSIEVRLFATLRNGRGKKIIFDYEENLTPLEIINRLNIDRNDVAILLVNGRDAQVKYSLKDNDYLSIFPPVGGGWLNGEIYKKYEYVIQKREWKY